MQQETIIIKSKKQPYIKWHHHHNSVSLVCKPSRVLHQIGIWVWARLFIDVLWTFLQTLQLPSLECMSWIGKAMVSLGLRKGVSDMIGWSTDLDPASGLTWSWTSNSLQDLSLCMLLLFYYPWHSPWNDNCNVCQNERP